MVSLLATQTSATRRQDLPPVYALNGAVYVATASWLRGTRTFVTGETVAHVMPAQRSIDVDTAADLEAVKRTLAGHPHVNVPA
jgi:N-acylneuraminate cytidylyltransferase